MRINHIVINAEQTEKEGKQTFLVKNTITNKYVRLGKNETSYLVSVLGEPDLLAELNIKDVQDIPLALKNQLNEKFKEWGFLDTTQKRKNQNAVDKLKKIHLVKFNVEKIINVIYPVYSKCFSKTTFIFLIIMMVTVVGYFTYALNEYLSQSGSSGESMNLKLHFTGGDLFIIVIFVLVNILLHEFAHAVNCVKYGGKVKNMGILLFYFIPCFYCDVTDVYGISDRKKRALVAASGVLVNLFIGNALLIIAVIFSYFNTVNILVYYLAFSIIGLSFYNLLPFVKLDGYWIVSALSSVDNLMDKSIILAYTSIFSRKNLENLKMKPIKRVVLSVYGMLSFMFHPLFWSYTFAKVNDFFKFNGIWFYAFIVTAVLIIIVDFIKMIKHYYGLITNDYIRVLSLI